MSIAIQHIVTTQSKPWSVGKVKPGSPRLCNLELDGLRHQVMRGFGGCFNELGYDVLRKLKDAQQERVFQALFGQEGCRFNFCRLPMGASDYALEWYSLNDNDGDYAMRHFSIERDKKCLIAYVKKALAVRRDISFFASPWSPPAWMKTHKTFNYGTLRWEKKNLQAYALYFQKYVEAYHAQGINIAQVHVQNEPVADQKFPSCIWTGEQMRQFIADYIGPRFAKEKVPAEVWLGTINGPESDARWSWSRFDQYANLVLSDPKASGYTKGVAYQWGGKHAMQKTHEAYPAIPLIQSESECGDGQNDWRYAHYIFELMQHYLANHAVAYVYWNMVLPAGGRSTWGWTQNSMITIDPATGRIRFEHEYYLMKHLCRYVQPGAVRLGLRGPWTSNALCFANPDASAVLVMANPFAEPRRLAVGLGSARFELTLEPSSFHTFVIPAGIYHG